VEILNQAFDSVDSSQSLMEILPFQSQNDVRRSECILKFIRKFIHWTDNSLLKSLDAIDDPAISARIESFSNRKLYKRGFDENLNMYLNSIGNEAEIMKRLGVTRKDMGARGIEWNVIPVPETLIPIFTKQVQRDILVQTSEKEEIPLAGFLDFAVSEDDILEKGDVYLRIFIQASSISHKEYIRSEIQEILKDFN
jgi:hypothetical protein